LDDYALCLRLAVAVSHAVTVRLSIAVRVAVIGETAT